MKRYILDHLGDPVPCMDLTEWCEWMGGDDRPRTVTKVAGGEVSTVFLGMDHNWGSGPPVLWETMVFGGKLDCEQDRYIRAKDAAAGHAAMVERAGGAK